MDSELSKLPWPACRTKTYSAVSGLKLHIARVFEAGRHQNFQKSSVWRPARPKRPGNAGISHVPRKQNDSGGSWCQNSSLKFWPPGTELWPARVQKKRGESAFRVLIRRPRRSGMVTGCPQTHPWMIQRFKAKNMMGTLWGSFRDIDSIARVATLERLRYVLNNTRGRLHHSHGPSRHRHHQSRSSVVRAFHQHHLHLLTSESANITLYYGATVLSSCGPGVLSTYASSPLPLN